MGQTTEELFKLIHGLTTQEKIRFKRYSTLTGRDTDYVEIFDYLVAQKEFDKEALKEHFAGKKFLDHLSKTLRDLLDTVLKALGILYYEADWKVALIQRKITIANKKGLDKKAYSLCREGIGLASAEERFGFWIGFLEESKNLILKKEILKEKEKWKEVENIRSELDRVRGLEAEFNRIKRLYEDVVYEGWSRYKESGKWDEDLIKRIGSDKAIESDSDSAIRTRLFQLIIRRTIAPFQKKFQLGYQFSQAAIDLFHKHPFLQIDYPEEYWNELHQLILFAFHNEDYCYAKEYLDLLSGITADNEKARASLFFQVSEVKLVFAGRSEFEKLGWETLKSFEKDLPGFENFMEAEERIRLFYFISHFLFQSGNGASAQKWLRKIIFTEKSSIRKDIQAFGRMLYIMSLFEQKDWEAIQSFQRSFRQFFTRVFPEFKVAQAILKFVAEAPKNLIKGKLEAKRAIMIKEITTQGVPENEEKGLNYFDYIEWLKAVEI